MASRAGREVAEADGLESPKQRRAYHAAVVRAFLEHTKVADVAAAVGISERSVHRWKAVAEWWAEVEAARGEVVRDAITRLRNGLPVAADRLVKVAKESTNDGVAVRAALALIEAHSQLTLRTDLEERIAALERARPGAFPRPTLLNGGAERAA